jgi:hypothetical protein
MNNILRGHVTCYMEDISLLRSFGEGQSTEGILTRHGCIMPDNFNFSCVIRCRGNHGGSLHLEPQWLVLWGLGPFRSIIPCEAQRDATNLVRSFEGESRK